MMLMDNGQQLPILPPQGNIKTGRRRPGGLRNSKSDVLAMQSILYARIIDPKCSDQDKARLALAWERLEERLRILRGKPLPGVLSPGAVNKKVRKSPFIVPIPQEKVS